MGIPMPNKNKEEDKKNNNNALGKKPQAKSPIPRVTLPKIDKKSGWRGFLIYAVLGIMLFIFFAATSNPAQRFMPVEPISTVISDIKNQKIKNIEIDGDKINVQRSDGTHYLSPKKKKQSLF